MSEELKLLKHKRGTIKSKLTRFKSYLDQNKAKIDETNLQLRISNVEHLLTEFEDIHSQIELLDTSGENQSEELESFEQLYFNTLSEARSLLADNTTLVRPNSSGLGVGYLGQVATDTNSHPSETQVKLPIINLPTFSGSFDEWHSFNEGFQALISQNNTLSDIHKFYYLKSCLKGEAASVLHSLETTASNYTIAWNLLKDRFENTRLIISKYTNSLFNYPKVITADSKEIRRFLDNLNKNIRALKALGQPTEHWDTLLIHLCLNKLPSVTVEEWEKSCKPKSLPTMTEFLLFLENKCHILETLETQCHTTACNGSKEIKGRLPVGLTSKQLSPKLNTYNSKQIKPNQSTFISTDSSKFNDNHRCELCQNKHRLFSCEIFLKMQVKDRINKIRDLGLCLNCLKPGGHRAYDCRSSGCKLCDKKHNTLLHIPTDTNKSDLVNDKPQTSYNNDKSIKPSAIKVDLESSTAVHSSHSVTSPSHVLLPTAIINVEDSTGHLVPCRALLDSGSQCNFITEHMAQILHLKKERVLSCVTGLGNLSTNSSKVVNATIRSRFTTYSANLNYIVLPKITIEMPMVQIDVSNWNLPNDIELADSNAHIPNKIDMLIGAEIFMDLLCNDSQLINSYPTLTKTKLGWIVSGKTERDIHALEASSHTTNLCHFISNNSLDSNLQRFWNLDEVGTTVKLSGENLLCEEHFKQTTKRDSSGRYTVSMPFKDNLNKLGDSYDLAKRRFEQLEKRFLKNPELKKDYSSFMNEYHELSHMERATVDEHQDNKLCYYIPHHAVIKESSTSTKLRVVFDCSAKPSSGLSLNDTLLVGPSIQQDLFSIINRFRTHNYVLNADLEKMYRQIMIDDTQRDCLRILWRDSSSEPIQIFRLKTVTYGSACAPFLATRTLQQLAQDEEMNFPYASKILTRDFYMDDLLTGGSSVDEVKQLQTDLISLLNKGGFKLRKWASNHPKLINHLPKEFVENKGDFSSEYSTKTLGLLWNSTSDSFHYSINTKKKTQEVLTKREVLSELSQIFDPLGLISPIIVQAKIFIQELWQSNLQWDEPLSDRQLACWNSFREELINVNKLTIPRRVLASDTSHSIQVHGFSDASESAYGACVYIRQIDDNGNINVRLLCSKSKVAPVKKTTLPRLELCAALLLARLMHRVLKILNLTYESCTLWSDSTIVLSWLMSPSSRWKTFVANRVSEIQELTKLCSWHHCRSEDNPADIVSRGKSPHQLIESTLWWNGPNWLGKSESYWPISKNQLKNDITLEERKVVLTTTSEENFIQQLAYKYSSFTKLQRVVAYCFRFVNNTKGYKILGPLNVQELNYARIAILKTLQQYHFKEEINNLKNDRLISTSSKLRYLQPFLDKQNTLRVGGRLQNSSILDYDQKHPIILPNHKLTKIIIEDIHKINLHIGPQQLLATVRQTYWPINAKNIVKKICRECVTCFKANPKTASQEMGILPKSRVEPSRPFINTGIDYCGPFNIKNKIGRGGTTSKAYIAVFVCLAVKAVHLELVRDLTSEAFLAALKRFMARRGKVKNIYSDNGTNFTGADNELKELKKLFECEDHQNMVKEELAAHNIEWHFTPPYSPHFGGLWEAVVKSTKYHLRRVAANTLMTYDELYTLLTQIEACLNSRPITPVSDDPNDYSYLTPGHFLIGEALTTNLEPDLTHLKINHLSRWQRIQQMFQQFWKRWTSEYLNQLQSRKKWYLEKKNVKVGDMVIVKEENLPPLKWSLGRIINTHPGSDNKVRVVTIKTSRGIFKRNITSVCPLPKEEID